MSADGRASGAQPSEVSGSPSFLRGVFARAHLRVRCKATFLHGARVRRACRRRAILRGVVTLEQFVDRLCRLGADRGPRRFPRHRLDRAILMKSILLLLDSARTYREAEINAVLLDWKRNVAPAIETDHVTLRRLLVDYGQLERTADGRAYRVGFPPGAFAFDLEIYDVDVRATVAAYLEHLRARSKRAKRARSEA